MSVITLSADEARRAALAAQCLAGARPGGGVPGLVRALGAIQLDTISVLARTHELVPYSRLGAVGKPTVERGLWGPRAKTFEYWAHAACVLPLESWPMFGYRRRRARTRVHPQGAARESEKQAVLRRLEAEGPLTASQLGGARSGGAWWSWSETKIAAEQLFNEGVVVCVERRRWQRVYDLAERAIPAALLALDLDDDACFAALLRESIRGMGVATRKDFGSHFYIKDVDVRRALPRSGLVEVRVEGWADPAYADADQLERLLARGARVRTTLLSPFDSLLWHRARVERLFGFRFGLEAYKKAPDREHGYYTMPLLAGGRLAGRVDPAREGGALVARQVSCERWAVPQMAAALRQAAEWVGCDSVRVERAEPGLQAGLEMLLG